MRRIGFAMLTWLLSVFACISLLAQNKAYELALTTIGGNVHLQEGGNKSTTIDPEYLIYVNDEQSFAIVSADGAQLLGYGIDANASEDMPPALIYFLEHYKQANRSIKLNKAALTPISPMLNTKWNQAWPYNMLCPTDKSNKQCATGCVATAMAQVLRYHGFPNKTTAQIPAYNTTTLKKSMSAIPAGSVINWSSMRNEYPKTDDGNTASNRAVAELMLYCGTSVNMDYGPSSGAFGFNVPLALMKYYGYQDLRYEFRDAFSKEDWSELVYGELKASRPILYCGSSPGGGHAFVFDGVDGSGLVHVNWGWGGQLDGYFDMDVLDPDDEGQIGAGSNGGYTSQAQILCNMKKPTGSAPQTHNTIWSPWKPIFWGEDDGVSYVEKKDGKYTFKVTMYFYREYYDRDEAYITIGIKKADGTFKPDDPVLVKDNGSGIYGYQYSITVDESDFDSNGLLSIYMLEKAREGDSYRPAGNAERNKIQLKCDGGRVYPYVDLSTRTKVAIPEVDKTEYVYNGEKQVYKIPASTQYNVEGNVQIDAGEYDVKVCLTDYLTLAWMDNTTLDKIYKFIIKKAVPNVVAPGEVFLAMKGERAKDVELPQGFVWQEPDYVFSTTGYHTLKCTYIPDDEKNYERIENMSVRVYVRNNVYTEVQLTEEQTTWGVPNGGMLEFDCEMEDGQTYESFDLVIEDKHYEGELSADGKLRFTLPEGMTPGVYMSVMKVDYTIGGEHNSIDIDVKFKVNYPSSYITTLWNDVLAVKNGGGLFSTFQWYKDKVMLEGQRRQYLPLRGCDEGEYTCKVYNSAGVELFITPLYYKYKSSFDIKVSPNPASANEQITITLEGLEDTDMENAKIYVHNLSGQIVATVFEVTEENFVTLDSGQYIVTAVVNNMKAGAIMIIVK